MLDETEQLRARRCLMSKGAADAVGSICLGDSMMILIATGLGFPSACVSAIGSLNFLSYLILPLGFVIAGRMGICRGIWTEQRGIMLSGLAIAAAAFFPGQARLLFPLALVGCYACRSCAASMVFSIQKNIAPGLHLPVLMSKLAVINSSVGLLTALAMAWVLSISQGMNALGGAAVAGALFYGIAGYCMSRSPEDPQLRENARRPIMPSVHDALASRVMRLQLLAGCALNLPIAMLLPVNILIAKHGYGMTNTRILLLTMTQSLSAIACSALFRYLSPRFGPRRVMIGAFPIIVILCLYWLLLPAAAPFWLLLPPFAIAGGMNIFFSTSLGNYFVMTIPAHMQVGGTFLVFVITGGLVGVAGVLLNPALLRLAADFAGGSLAAYKLYFALCIILFLPGLHTVITLPPEREV